MAQKRVSRLIRTPMVRMSYPKLHVPEKYKDPATGRERGDPYYTCELLIPKDSIEKFQVQRDEGWTEINLKRVMAEVATERWGGQDDWVDVKTHVNGGSLGWPLRDGDKKAAAREAEGKKGEFYQGHYILPVKANEEYPPELHCVEDRRYRKLDRTNDADAAKIKAMFVGGNYGKFSLNLAAVESPQGRYVTFYVNAVAFVKEGTRIGGMSAEDRFGGIEGGESDYDPTDGMDDEIPF